MIKPSVEVNRDLNIDKFKNFRDKKNKFDITNFESLHSCMIGDFIISWVWYENSKDYNSQKILVWKGLTISEFKQLEQMDPYFSPSTKLFAVFKPTKDMYNEAIDMARLLSNNSKRPYRGPKVADIYLT